MNPRRYVSRLISLPVVAFLAVVATNLIIDPQAVFGTGVFGVTLNANSRYLTFANYRAASDKFDGLLFGSSRALAISSDELSQHTKGVNFARFVVNGGMVVDYLPILEFAVRDKARQGQHLRTVFLMLDADSFGRRQTSQEAIQQLAPPGLSQQSAFSFWWANLTAIEFKSWRDTVRLGLRNRGSGNGVSAGSSGAGVPAEMPQVAPLPPVEPNAAGEQLDRVTRRPEFTRHLKALERMAMLCRDAGIELVAATAPLSRYNAQRYDPDDLAMAIAAVSRIVPLWDFTFSDFLSDRPDVWIDWSHFQPQVGHMMLARIFGEPLPEDWKHFGKRMPAN